MARFLVNSTPTCVSSIFSKLKFTSPSCLNCSSFFKSDKLPGRTCIGVTGLAVGSLVEIDFVAAV